MIFGSVCSGIEAASVAWHPLGWQAAFVSEIEPFPCAVLAHHYPAVPNLGDMTKFKEWPDAKISVLVGGTPCQSFSVAGLRAGLADPRGNLMLTYLAIADRYRPEWLVWENVPGVLSSNGRKDFGTFLSGLAELGYGFAYRVLDAQHFGVPQRRRRVFVVANLRDWRRAAAVLFERESLRGDSPPSRESGEGIAPSVIKGAAIGRKPEAGPQYGEHLSDGSCYTLNCTEQHAVVAPTISARTRGGGELGTDFDCDGGLIPRIAKWPAEIAPTLNAHFGDKWGLEDQHALSGAGLFVPGVTHSLRAEGFDAREDGTGRGTPLIHCPGVAMTLTSGGKGERGRLDPVNTDLVIHCPPIVPQATDCYNGAITGDVAATLGTPGSSVNASGPTVMVAHPINTQIAMRHEAMGEGTGFGIGRDGDPAFTLQSAHSHAVAFAQNTRDEVREMAVVGALAAEPGMKQTSYIRSAMQVRRLTPRECERLQGFPDDYTLITVRNKPAADGPRYKALGNSMAVPCMKWLGERIQMVQNLLDNSER